MRDILAEMSFKDHFSTQAAAYALARPTYPAALFDWLADQCAGRQAVWDAGCGNGQAALTWARHFDWVFASDPSAAQIASAVAHPRVCYAVERAEVCSLADGSVDLVAVAQALHWFDFAPFFDEVRRVLRPCGIFAAWCYGSMRIDPALDAELHRFEHETVGAFWPPERAHVDAAYATIGFPFRRIDTPAFEMAQDWDLAQTLAYLDTWSAVQRHDAAHGRSAIEQLRPGLAQAWGDRARRRRVVWPLATWVGHS